MVSMDRPWKVQKHEESDGHEEDGDRSCLVDDLLVALSQCGHSSVRLRMLTCSREISWRGERSLEVVG